MISPRSMTAAKKYAEYEKLGPPEQLQYFNTALKDVNNWWILRNGKWRPRKDGWTLTEETKKKMSEKKLIMNIGEKRNENQETNH